MNIPGTGFITYNAYTWNQPSLMTLPGGSTKQFSYDPLMRLKDMDAKDPAKNAILNYQYAHDKMDNIIQKNTEHGDYLYVYDDLYRLTTADNPLQDDEAFTYDGVGNRLTSTDTAGEWMYNQNNELDAYDDVSYEYDANGNMVKKTVGTSITSYVYNTEDRLIEVWNGEAGTGSLIAEYYYDPFGRRLWKEVSGVRTYFHYSDEGLIGEYDATGNEIKTYGYKPGSTWTTDPLFMKKGEQYYFYQNDHLGTPQKLTSTNGAVVWSAKYSSFGEAEVDVTSTVVNNSRFAGQYYDYETGLHYNWHRYYDSVLGRYLRADPIGFDGGINFFSYCLGNPINNFDPDGHFVITLPTIVITGVIAAVTVYTIDEIIDYNKQKSKFKKYNKPEIPPYGGPFKVRPPGHKDECEALKKALNHPNFKCLPLRTRILSYVMYIVACGPFNIS